MEPYPYVTTDQEGRLQITRASAVTSEMIKAKLNLALTEQSLFTQKLHDEAATLIFNEDNLEGIRNFINKIKSADSIIEKKHAELKKPYLDAGRSCDAAKNELLTLTGDVRMSVHAKYAKICNDIRLRQENERREAQINQDALNLIETNVIEYSNRIAQCETNPELLAIERIINIQRSPSSAAKYGHYHSQALERYDKILLPILKDQKAKIKQKEEADKKFQEALKQGDDAEKIDQLQQEKETAEQLIKQNQVKVQEQAISQAPVISIGTAREVFPAVKARRTTWKVELVDVKAALKGAPSLLDITLNPEAAKASLQMLKGSDVFVGKKEITINGIRYYEEVTF